MSDVYSHEGLDPQSFDSVDAVDEAIKVLRDRRKELKSEQDKAQKAQEKAEKEQAMAEAKSRLEAEGLEEGDPIRAILKGEEVAGSFVKATEARFIVLVDGEKKTLPFDKFVSRDGDSVQEVESQDAEEEVV
ncbi:MAG: hypothetical protein ACOC1X_00975 [Promethearchaeota archaeon]